MIKFGYPTNPGKDIVSDMKRIKKMGFDYPEIFMEIPNAKSDMLMKEKVVIKKTLSTFGAPSITHTFWKFDISSIYESVRNAWIREFKECIDVTHELGIGKINIHLNLEYSVDEKTKKAHLDIFCKSLEKIIDYANKCGIKIILENTEGSQGRGLKNMDYVLKKVPNVGAHLDFGHSNITDDFLDVVKFIIKYSKRIEHIHMHDNHGLEDEHAALGEGNLRVAHIAKLLKKIGYDKTITLEIFWSKEKDIIKSLNMMKKLMK
jgi:sugar phosphate isomerase/epimerase